VCGMLKGRCLVPGDAIFPEIQMALCSLRICFEKKKFEKMQIFPRMRFVKAKGKAPFFTVCFCFAHLCFLLIFHICFER
jgi:hypothetical protein